jgi:hypothetical protein
MFVLPATNAGGIAGSPFVSRTAFCAYMSQGSPDLGCCLLFFCAGALVVLLLLPLFQVRR